MGTDEYGRTWRYYVADDGTITRGRLYQIPEEWNSWSSYWEGSDVAGFYDEGRRGRRILDNDATEDSARAMGAYLAAKNYGDDPLNALDKVAWRITGNLDARFICVRMNWDVDLYVLSWSGDPDNEWRDEIAAVASGEVYRIEAEEYTGLDGAAAWMTADDMCEEFYGEANGQAAWEEEFPLAEFPAERFIGEPVGA